MNFIDFSGMAVIMSKDKEGKSLYGPTQWLCGGPKLLSDMWP